MAEYKHVETPGHEDLVGYLGSLGDVVVACSPDAFFPRDIFEYIGSCDRRGNCGVIAVYAPEQNMKSDITRFSRQSSFGGDDLVQIATGSSLNKPIGVLGRGNLGIIVAREVDIEIVEPAISIPKRENLPWYRGPEKTRSYSHILK